MLFPKIAVFILTIISINNCCSTGTISTQSKDSVNYKKIAVSKFGNNHKVTFNSDSTFLIVSSYQNKTTDDISSPLRFFVFNLSENEITFEENLPNGNIKWINNHQIEVTTEPGIVSGDEGKNKQLTGYTYDIILNKKILNGDEIQNQ
jgi:hypothetical protein